ncbi:hydrogenase maturation protease [Streptomyces hazeniae]|uniref:hydrogenase maturation protease n=1 Tax=Streptomyces hazeniae TaxID=3075538 RepID=UPI00374E0ED9
MNGPAVGSADANTGPETAPGRILVAGIGNIFLGDDGFGVETARRLREETMPPGVEVQDTGVRGVHLAYQLLDGYAGLVLVDAVPGDDPPGTLRVIEPGPDPAGGPVAVVDGHRMTPDAVLGLLDTLAEGTGEAGPSRVLVVGCVPETVEEGMGLSRPVAAAVPEAVLLVRELVDDLIADLLPHPEAGAAAGGPT